jgi:hypothetical protein
MRQTSSRVAWIILSGSGLACAQTYGQGIAEWSPPAVFQIDPITGEECTAPHSFIPIALPETDHALHMVRSNMGGQGGRCYTTDDCVEVIASNADAAASTPHELYIAGVGTDYSAEWGGSGESIDLRITNTTEYRAWNPATNGLKEADSSGAFVMINLLAPRHEGMYGHWHASTTAVELKLEFVSGATQQPLALGRTYLTVYDFDGGNPSPEHEDYGVHGSPVIAEVLQVGPEAAATMWPSTTEIRVIEDGDWAELNPGSPGNETDLLRKTGTMQNWGTPLFQVRACPPRPPRPCGSI